MTCPSKGLQGWMIDHLPQQKPSIAMDATLERRILLVVTTTIEGDRDADEVEGQEKTIWIH